MIEKKHLRRVDYRELNGKQQEIYNFQKVAARFADYGFNCIKLDDDWMGADFLAYHKDGTQTAPGPAQRTPDAQQEVHGQGTCTSLPAPGRLVSRAPRHPRRHRRGRLRTGSIRLLGKRGNTLAPTRHRRH